MRITIGGKAGSGKTSVARELAKDLKLKHYSMGDFMGELATERGISILELSKLAESSGDIDKQIDDKQKALNKQDGFVIDSRLGFHFINESVKVFLDVDDDVGAKRIFGDEREDESENTGLARTKENIRTRMESEKKRYMEYYGVNPYDLEHYDLLIDTSDDSIQQTSERIIKFLEHQKLYK